MSEAERIADLCKADLVTDVVREFPELQGVMARLYAMADKEPLAVAEALEQHYWPITLTGALPKTDLAASVALADKIDTLAGDFAVGLIPSGSADPYGLRRAAVGVLRILEDRHCVIGIEELLSQAIDFLPPSLVSSRQDTFQKLFQFIKQRFTAILEERGYRFDEIDAVLGSGMLEVPDALARLKALHGVRAKTEFEPLSVAFKRSMNIVRQASR